MTGLNAIFSNKTRLTGLSSALDTDSIVKNLMSIERLKVDRQERAMTRLTWHQDALNSIGDKLKAFRSSYLSVLGSSSMVSSSTYKSFKVTQITGEKSVTVTANAEASSGKVTVNNVLQLAENAKAASGDKVSADGTMLSESNLTKLSDLKFLNSIGFENDEIGFAINGKQFTFKASDTLQNMVNTINGDGEANVTFTYSRLSDKFTLEAKSGGASSEIKIENIKGNAFGVNSAFGITEGEYKNGKNAIVTIEGIEVERNSNKFTIDGISYTLNQVTDTESAFMLEQDVQASVDKIKGFFEAYNKLITELTGMVTEKKDYSFSPLTELQRKDMNESDVALWENKAKAGILNNNSELRNLLADLRSLYTSPAGGTGKTLADIGITSGSYFTSDKGMFVIDDYALSEALKNNPDEVLGMFAGIDPSNENNGVMQNMVKTVNKYINSAQKDELNTVREKISSFKSKISEMEGRMIALSERYYKKYAAMEKSLSKLNAQGDWLANQLSALTSK